MPKGRHLKPDFFTDKHVVSVSPLARLLYQGLWCYAHDCGHLDDEPLELKMRILPADPCDVGELLGELADAGRITRSNGVIYVPKLRDHSRIDKRYETFCDDCKVKTRSEHDVMASPTRGTTKPTRRDHAAPEAQHDADGDGDGEVMVMGSDGDGEPPPRAKRATQLPPDWAPKDQHTTIVQDRGLNGAEELAKFRDWATATGKTYKDWDAAFRNWLRNARPTPGNTNRRQTETNDMFDRAMQRARAREQQTLEVEA